MMEHRTLYRFPGARRLLSDPALRRIQLRSQKLLVRTDGLVVKVTDLAWELLKTISQGSDLHAMIDRWGAEDVQNCDDELAQLAEEAGDLEPSPFDLTVSRGGKPGGLVLMVAQSCNLACRYCFGHGGCYGSNRSLMSQGDAIKAVDLMIARGGDRKKYSITFFGGEPLLNLPVIAAVVAYCERLVSSQGLEFHYSITTNGTILTDGVLEMLRSRNFGVMVSLDGPASVHDENRPFRNGRGSYEKVAGNIRRMVGRGIKVQLRGTLTRGAIERRVIPRTLLLADELGVDRVVLAVVDGSQLNLEDLELTARELSRLEELCEEISEEQVEAARQGTLDRVLFSPHASLMNSLARGTAQGVGRCGACQGMAAVSTDGAVYPCHRFVGMDAYRIGDLEGGIDEDRTNAFFAAVQRAYEPVCGSCWVRGICQGTCFYHSADGRGGFRAPDPMNCVRYQSRIESSLGLLAAVKGEESQVVQRFAKAIRRF